MSCREAACPVHRPARGPERANQHRRTRGGPAYVARAGKGQFLWPWPYRGPYHLSPLWRLSDGYTRWVQTHLKQYSYVVFCFVLFSFFVKGFNTVLFLHYFTFSLYFGLYCICCNSLSEKENFPKHPSALLVSQTNLVQKKCICERFRGGSLILWSGSLVLSCLSSL